MPSVLRFLSCAGILYFGFLFCGWIVIGPYHPKVKNFFLFVSMIFNATKLGVLFHQISVLALVLFNDYEALRAHQACIQSISSRLTPCKTCAELHVCISLFILFQFSTPLEVSECLYSLINGDDMYPTFHEMSKDNYQLWIFSKIYLYVFISLFIFIVLSLFIGIISDTYERLKVCFNLYSICLFAVFNLPTYTTLKVCWE